MSFKTSKETGFCKGMKKTSGLLNSVGSALKPTLLGTGFTLLNAGTTGAGYMDKLKKAGQRPASYG